MVTVGTVTSTCWSPLTALTPSLPTLSVAVAVIVGGSAGSSAGSYVYVTPHRSEAGAGGAGNAGKACTPPPAVQPATPGAVKLTDAMPEPGLSVAWMRGMKLTGP